jgi:hypothetical protein
MTQMKMYKKLVGLSLACTGLLAVSLQAQPNAPTAVQQMQNFQRNMEQQQPLAALRAGTNAPEIYPGENSDIGPQQILRLVPRRTHFEIKADSQYLYTDNAQLTQNNPTPATEFVNSISAAFAPTAYKLGSGRFAPEVGYLSQWFNYGLGNHDLSVMDFNVQTVFAGAKYLLPNNWEFFGEFDYTRLLSQQNYDEFYHDFTPTLGVQRLFPIGDKGVVSATLQTDYHDSWTVNPPNNSQDRMDDTFSLSLSYQLASHLAVQPYYRFQYTYYRFDSLHNSGRDDFLNSVGLIVAYNFRLIPGMALRGFVNYDVKNSDDISPALGGAQRYHDYNIGADLSYTIRF